MLQLLLLATSLVAFGCSNSVKQAPRTSERTPTQVTSDGAPAVAKSFAVPEAWVPIGARDPILGNPLAPVTVVVFSDYQCSFCARAQDSLEEIAQRYPDKVRFVIKNLPLPFHEHARDAAVMAQAVFERKGRAAFEPFAKKLYANHDDLTPEHLVEWAKEAGLSPAEADTALNDPRYGAKVTADAALAEHAGIQGTPGFLINGRMLVGAQPATEFARLIEQELAEIKALPKPYKDVNELYRDRTRTNIESRQPESANAEGEDDEAGPDLAVHQVPIASSPIDGPATALVTIVMFTDFQCPYCLHAEQTLADVRKRYGQEVRLVFKHAPLPFHAEALPAARFAQRVFTAHGNAKFWPLARRLFEKQAELGSALYLELAKELGLPQAEALALDRPISLELERALLADQMLAEELKVEGTPQFFINGRRLMGAQPAESFARLIDERLVLAKQIVAGGISSLNVYGEIMKTAQAAAPSPPERVSVAAPNAPRPYRGSPKAKVVVELFSDFQCAFCQRVRGTLDALQRLHPKEVRLVWRNLPLPFHTDAALAAEAALEAFEQRGSVGFWKMEALLFEKREALSRDYLEKYAAKIGLDLKQFRLALDDHRHRAAVLEDSEAAGRAKIQGTPTAVINGYIVSGAQPLAAFERVVQLALSEKQ